MTDLSIGVLPARLNAMIQAGRWPSSSSSVNSQNLRPVVAAERVQLFAPGESLICLMPPPFRTIADHAEGKMLSLFWSKYGALDMISPRDALVIGDFGIGSDAPIILDYRDGTRSPPVLWLCWEKDGPRRTTWVKGGDDFDEFADLLEL